MKIKPRLTMEDYGLELAAVVARRAACTRRQVGAVIIGPDKRILATGYNGTDAGAVHCTDGGCPRGASDLPVLPRSAGNSGMAVPCIARHAERNAIDWCVEHEIDLTDATIYVTHQTCPDCAELAEHHKLRVVWPW
jgi:dCMP deaminase